MRARALAPLLLLSSLTLAGCTASDGGGSVPLPDEWRGRDLRKEGWTNVTIKPGWTYALEYQWSSGQRVSWDWFVFEPVFIHFQVVRQDAGQLRVLQAGDGQEQPDPPGRLTVPQSGLHQLDLLNEYWEPVTVAVRFPSMICM